MPPTTPALEEGTAFAVPLHDGQGYARGVVARAAPRGRVLLGYFFGPALDALPTREAMDGLRSEVAVYIARFGDLNLVEGEWPVLGQLTSWQRDEWPMPDFCRSVDDDRAFLAVSYRDDDVSDMVVERRVERDECESLPEDGLAGAEFVELRLTRLLGGA